MSLHVGSMISHGFDYNIKYPIVKSWGILSVIIRLMRFHPELLTLLLAVGCAATAEPTRNVFPPVLTTETPFVSPTVALSKSPTPTLTPEPTRTTMPANTPTNTPTSTPEASGDVAKIRARQRALIPDYDEIVDPDLANRAAMTVLLYGCGFDHEPPAVEKVYICSNSLFVLNKDGTLDVVTYTHDTRAPEAERAKGTQGQPGSALRLEQTWIVGGAQLSRQTFQDATGYPVDYFFQFDDKAIRDFVDKVLGGKIKVHVPTGFVAQPIYLDADTKIDAREFKAGAQEMDAATYLQYMKAVVKAEKYPPELENNVRKHVAIRALLFEMRSRFSDVRFWVEGVPAMFRFLDEEIKAGIVNTDVDSEALKSLPLSVPRLGKDLYLADSNVTGDPDSPLIWGMAESNDPFVLTDLQKRVYKSGYVEVPKNCDPYSPKLHKDCWQEPRKYLKNRLFFNR